MPQSALVEQPPPETLHAPIGPHAPSPKQLAPEMLQSPGWVGHWASAVHTSAVMLQLPANVGGGQLVTRWHSTPSGRGTIAQLGSFQSMLQVEGSGSMRWMLAHVCERTLLHVCPLMLQLCVCAPPQVWPEMPAHVWFWTPPHVCGVRPPHVCPVEPPHVW